MTEATCKYIFILYICISLPCFTFTVFQELAKDSELIKLIWKRIGSKVNLNPSPDFHVFLFRNSFGLTTSSATHCKEQRNTCIFVLIVSIIVLGAHTLCTIYLRISTKNRRKKQKKKKRNSRSKGDI